MKKWLAAFLCMLLPCSFAEAQAINPYLEVPAIMPVTSSQTDQWLVFSDLDFSAGAASLRIKASTDDQLTIRVYADTLDSPPVATALFQADAREALVSVVLNGMHDL